MYLTFPRKQPKGSSTRKPLAVGSGKVSESRGSKRKRTTRGAPKNTDQDDPASEEELEDFSQQIGQIEGISDSPDDDESEGGDWAFTISNDASRNRYGGLNGKSSSSSQRKKTRASFDNVDNGIISLEISD